MAEAVAGLFVQRPGFSPRPLRLGFVVVRVALGWFILSEYFSFTLSPSLCLSSKLINSSITDVT